MSSPPLSGPLPRWPLAPLAAMFCALGCVIPVAPQWDDPEINYPPYVFNSSPTEGDIFTPATTTSPSCTGPSPSSACDKRDINATLSDQNIDDHLFIHWLVDYPSTDTNIPHLVREVELPSSGMALRSAVHIQPDCHVLSLGPGDHRWVMSVSDRKFLDALGGDDVSPEAPLDSVPDGANRIRVLWVLHCP
jgi:hypothetical protein